MVFHAQKKRGGGIAVYQKEKYVDSCENKELEKCECV